MRYIHRNKGTCSSSVSFELDSSGIVTGVEFIGGCNGNLNAISKLVDGMPADRIIELLQGNRCGGKPTSCADQFASGIKEALEAEARR